MRLEVLASQTAPRAWLVHVCSFHATSMQFVPCWDKKQRDSEQSRVRSAADLESHGARFLRVLAPMQRVDRGGCTRVHGPLPVVHFALFFAASASLRVASSSNAVSTAPEGRCTYRITEPRMNMSFVEHCRRHGD